MSSKNYLLKRDLREIEEVRDGEFCDDELVLKFSEVDLVVKGKELEVSLKGKK